MVLRNLYLFIQCYLVLKYLFLIILNLCILFNKLITCFCCVGYQVIPYTSYAGEFTSSVTGEILSSLRLKPNKPKTLHLCDYCDKAFDFKSFLDRHVVKHTGDTPFSCENCGRRFKYQGAASNHRHVCRLFTSQ